MKRIESDDVCRMEFDFGHYFIRVRATSSVVSFSYGDWENSPNGVPESIELDAMKWWESHGSALCKAIKSVQSAELKGGAT